MIITQVHLVLGEINQHGYHNILQQYAITSGLSLVVTIICFSTGQWPITPTGCVRVIGPRRRVMECCIRWPGLHNQPTSTQLRWFGMSCTAEWRKSSQQVLSICGNSFKTVGKSFQVKMVERMPRVCKAVFVLVGDSPIGNSYQWADLLYLFKLNYSTYFDVSNLILSFLLLSQFHSALLFSCSPPAAQTTSSYPAVRSN